MGALPFFKVQETIEQRIDEYSAANKGIVLPVIDYRQIGKNNNVMFGLWHGNCMYSVVKGLIETLGEMKLGKNFVGHLQYERSGLEITISPHLINESEYLINFSKVGDYTSEEIDAIVHIYKEGNPSRYLVSPKQRLTSKGVTIYEQDKSVTWDDIAGYDGVKQDIRDTIILPMQNPELYEQIAHATRKRYESIKPRAVLFEGPPGTGKTTTARIIANEVAIPMVYVPIESIMSKWYGEAEKNLAEIFDACTGLGKANGNAIIFLDEIDSLATARDNDMHEATRKILSVLLRHIDGFVPMDNTLLIGATNRKQDLDPALISRFDVSIYFGLPNPGERAGIFGNYAKHLSDSDLEKLAQESNGMSGRTIKEVCRHSERRWASGMIKSGQTSPLPSLEYYLGSIKLRNDSRS